MSEPSNIFRAPEDYFEKLYKIDCSGKTEKKNGLTYLSWAFAWEQVKRMDHLATFTIYEDKDGRFYHTDGRTCWVKTGVTIFGIEHIEYLPVMDYRNASIPLEKVTSYDVNKTIQRSLTKAIARHGLGLHIYQGFDDLPEEAKESAAPVYKCAKCGRTITEYHDAKGKTWSATDYAGKVYREHGEVLCPACLAKKKEESK